MGCNEKKDILANTQCSQLCIQNSLCEPLLKMVMHVFSLFFSKTTRSALYFHGHQTHRCTSQGDFSIEQSFHSCLLITRTFLFHVPSGLPSCDSCIQQIVLRRYHRVYCAQVYSFSVSAFLLKKDSLFPRDFLL